MCRRRAFSSSGAHGGPALWLAPSLWPWKPSHGWMIPPLNMTWGKDRKQGHHSLSLSLWHTHTFCLILFDLSRRTHVLCWWCNQGVCHSAHGRITEGELEVNKEEKQITLLIYSCCKSIITITLLRKCSLRRDRYALCVSSVWQLPTLYLLSWVKQYMLNKIILFLETLFLCCCFFYY